MATQVNPRCNWFYFTLCSGGGGYRGEDYSSYPRGGEGGGDGEDGNSRPGGRGSGLDIGQINFRDFKLTPGAGGEHSDGGGGGGGVLVNGLGPEAGENNGQGYGGGAGASKDANPGCVIIEV